MAALTEDLNVPHRYKERVMKLSVAASTTIYAGAIVAVNAAGYAVPASDAANLVVVGRAEERVDNSSGANGDLDIAVAAGVFRWNNAGSNTVAQANVNGDVYVIDDNTIDTVGGTNNIVAGKCQEVDSDGVWVKTQF